MGLWLVAGLNLIPCVGGCLQDMLEGRVLRFQHSPLLEHPTTEVSWTRCFALCPAASAARAGCLCWASFASSCDLCLSGDVLEPTSSRHFLTLESPARNGGVLLLICAALGIGAYFLAKQNKGDKDSDKERLRRES